MSEIDAALRKLVRQIVREELAPLRQERKGFFTVAEIAAMFEVSKATVNRWHRAKALGYSQITTRDRISTQVHVEEFLKSREKPCNQKRPLTA